MVIDHLKMKKTQMYIALDVIFVSAGSIVFTIFEKTNDNKTYNIKNPFYICIKMLSNIKSN